jgi:hypothetical protein
MNKRVFQNQHGSNLQDTFRLGHCRLTDVGHTPNMPKELRQEIPSNKDHGAASQPPDFLQISNLVSPWVEQDHQVWNIDGMSEYGALDAQDMTWLEDSPLDADLKNNYLGVNPFSEQTLHV